jgi:uncharacterized protein
VEFVLRPRLTYNAFYCIVTKMSDQKFNPKFALLAGILAAGLFAAVFAGTQMVQSAAAQNNTESQPPVTSADDIDCSVDPSLVHCVDGNVTTASTFDTSSGTTVTTSGTATANADPDKFSVTVGVETNGTTAEEAASANADLIAEVLTALRELGIADEDMTTSNYSIYPVYSTVEPLAMCIDIFPPPPECQSRQEITGYKASSSITVTLDADGEVDAGQVIDTAVEAGANTVSGAYYFLSTERQEQVREELIADAIANARHRADIAAEAVGMEVSGVKSINLNDVSFPVFSRGLEAADTQILPGQQEVSMTVTVVYSAGNGEIAGGEDDGSIEAVAVAREFILSKLPELGIEIDDELDLHTDMVVVVSESEFHVDYSVMDVNGQSHDGRIEIVDGEVTVAILDGESIL